MSPNPIRPLRVAYAIQNVGGIDFNRDLGDTVPVKNTLRGLKRQGHQVVCLKLHGRSIRAYDDISRLDQFREPPVGISGSALFKTAERGIRRAQRELRIPYFAFLDSFRFYEACVRFLPGYSLCHEHNGLFCIGAALASNRLGIPYVLTFSSDPLFERGVVGHPLRGLHYSLAAWEASYTYRLARKIICVSEPAREHLIETWRVTPDKVVVLPNGVDSDHFKPGHDPKPVREMFGLDNEPTIGFLGAFQPWHGIELLIESLAEVQKTIPDARLLLIGDGRARPAIEEKIDELGLRSSVIITGLIPMTDVPKFLAAVDVAAIPYPLLPKELWFSPLKLYEYMAAGKAIVASRSGQIATVIKDGWNGLLVEPGDIRGLAASIGRLLSDEADRSRLGANARIQAVEKHSWERYICLLEEIYLSVQ